MLCPNCGSFIPAGEPYCPSCGSGFGSYEEEIEYVKCPNCHKDVDKSQIHHLRCPSCNKIMECPVCLKILTDDDRLGDLENVLKRYEGFFENKLQNPTSNVYNYFNMKLGHIQSLFYTDFIEGCPLCGEHLNNIYDAYSYIFHHIYAPLLKKYPHRQANTLSADDFSEISYEDYTAILNKLFKKVLMLPHYLIHEGRDEYNYFGLKRTKNEILDDLLKNIYPPEKIINRIVEGLVYDDCDFRLPSYVEHENRFYFKESYTYMIFEVFNHEEKFNRSPQTIKYPIVNNHVYNEAYKVLEVEPFNTNALIQQTLALIQLEEYDSAKMGLESLLAHQLTEEKYVEIANIYERLTKIMDIKNQYQDLSLQKRLFEELEKQDFRTALVIVKELLDGGHSENYIFKALNTVRNHYLRMYQLQLDLGYDENANTFVFEYLYVIPNDKEFLLSLIEIEKQRGDNDRLFDLLNMLKQLD